MAQEKYKKDKAANKDQIAELNQRREKVLESERFSK
jgi:hypothetical protein